MLTLIRLKLRPALAIACATGIFALTTLPAVGDEQLPQLIADWYQALRQNDHEAMDSLLAEAAVVELRDIGVTQTKAEFVEALDEWSELNADTTLLTRLNTAGENEIVVDVCYRFTSNEVQTREAFSIADNQITHSVQEQASENCTGF